MGYLRKIAAKIGMDKAIAYSSSARVYQAIAGFVNVIAISAFLTAEEQGFYYTFGSLLAVQTFFELGFSGIITQYVAHEAAQLEIKGRMVIGSESKLSRLASLLHFTTKWYSIAALLLLLVLLTLGFVFFNSAENPTNINWEMPWILISFATVIRMVQSPFSSILLGLDKVVEVNKIMFWQQVITPVFLWIMLANHMRLYVVGLSSLVTASIWFIFVYKTKLYQLLMSILSFLYA